MRKKYFLGILTARKSDRCSDENFFFIHQSVALDNYIPVSYSSRTEFRGAGTAIFTKKEIIIQSLQPKVRCFDKHFEFCCCQLNVRKKLYIML